MEAKLKLAKVAAIREPGYPVGKPAPCYLNCACGHKPRTNWKDDVRCACGTLYTGDGYVKEEK